MIPNHTPGITYFALILHPKTNLCLTRCKVDVIFLPMETNVQQSGEGGVRHMSHDNPTHERRSKAEESNSKPPTYQNKKTHELCKMEAAVAFLRRSWPSRLPLSALIFNWIQLTRQLASFTYPIVARAVVEETVESPPRPGSGLAGEKHAAL